MFYDDNSLRAAIHVVTGNEKEYFSESNGSGYIEDPAPDPSKSLLKKQFDDLGFHPAQISDIAMEIRSLLLSSDQDASQSRPINALAKKLILDPVGHDPLSFAPSETLLAMGDEKKLNVVARLNDDCVQKTGAVSGNMSGPATFLANRAIDNEVTADDRWIRIRPKQTLEEERTRANRRALSAFINSFNDLGYPSIEAEAAYVAAHKPYGGITLGYWWPLLLQYRGDPFENQSRTALRLYGLLNPAQRSLQVGGAAIPIDQFSGEQLSAAVDWIMDAQQQGIDDSDESYAAQSQSTIIDASNSEKVPDSDQLIYWRPFDELLDTLSQSFLDGARLSMVPFDGPSIKQKTPDNYEMWTTLQQLALSRRTSNEHQDKLSYAIGKKHGILMRLDLSSKAQIHTMLTDHYGLKGNWGPYSSLPVEIKRQIEEQMKRNNPYSFDSIPAPADPDKVIVAPPGS